MQPFVLSLAVLICLGLGAGLVAAQGAAEPVRVYPYAHTENFCPAGLQPVSWDGTVSCGKPNQTTSYQAATRAPASQVRIIGSTCPPGVKGC